MPVRNEDWILRVSLRAALRWCDSVVVLNHASTDRTAEIIAEVQAEEPGRVHVLTDSDPGWPEMAHRQRLLEASRRLGATHIAIVDADEVLTGNLLPTIRETIAALSPGEQLQVGMPCMWRSLSDVRTDSRIWSNRHDLALAFCDMPSLSWAPLNGYDHHHRPPHGIKMTRRTHEPGGVMHLQFSNWRRLTAKHALYKCMERLKYPDKPIRAIESMYNLALDESGLRVVAAPPEWWEPYASTLGCCDMESEPWQKAEVRRLVDLHGTEAFTGLNLFGVPDAVAA